MYVRTYACIKKLWIWETDYNQLQSIGAKNVLRQKNSSKKNLEKNWSLSKMICSSVRLKAAKEKVNWHVCKGVRTCVWMYLYSMETNAKL